MSLYICNTVAVGLFGIVLSAAFCNIRWDRKNVLWMAAATAAIYLLQAVVYFGIDTTQGQYLYPIHAYLVAENPIFYVLHFNIFAFFRQL